MQEPTIQVLLMETSSVLSKGSANETNIKKWCEEIFDKEILEENNPYTAVKKWCTKG
ncbi:hypothetical protein [Candidatus Mycoplasma haematobovis]|uniref:hypothetical protein n=1 Tax=Candidatus Mycoplasma haematobovis TaxID=432608 RepID=UPI00164EF159|nr:hypothetical protein [Candidatus Mycoplasma haematobovis]